MGYFRTLPTPFRRGAFSFSAHRILYALPLARRPMERSARAEHQDPQFVNPRFFVKFQARPANSAVIQTRFKNNLLFGTEAGPCHNVT